MTPYTMKTKWGSGVTVEDQGLRVEVGEGEILFTEYSELWRLHHALGEWLHEHECRSHLGAIRCELHEPHTTHQGMVLAPMIAEGTSRDGTAIVRWSFDRGVEG